MILSPEISDRLLGRLERLYGAEAAGPTLEKLSALVERWQGKFPSIPGGWSERVTFLITYADTLVKRGEKPLVTLLNFLNQKVGERITFLHLLPFFPFSSDDGFSVIDYREVRDDLGGWDEIRDMADAGYRLVFDGVINHVSQHSKYVQGYLAGEPDYEDFCVALDPTEDTSSVTRPRTTPLLHEFEAADGKRWLWTTFGRDQVDLNYANPEVLLEILDVLMFYAWKGAAMVRLDAIPYLWKRLGTTCVHLPETHQVIKLIRDVYDAVSPGMILLSETNVPHRENISYWGNSGDEAQKIYNFSLAPLVLFTLTTGTVSRLTEWAGKLEAPDERCLFLNITATHDGIGMRPTEGILRKSERETLLDLAVRHGGSVSTKSNPDGSETPYELNLTYFDAINDPNSDVTLKTQVTRFLVSQAIPMVLMGVPGIYIHSLLGSRNDYASRERTGRPRSINREILDAEEIEKELHNPKSRRARILNGILRLLEIRQSQPAFHPNAPQMVVSVGRRVFGVLRTSMDGGQTILALFNVTGKKRKAQIGAVSASRIGTNLINGEKVGGMEVRLAPYEICWISFRN